MATKRDRRTKAALVEALEKEIREVEHLRYSLSSHTDSRDKWRGMAEDFLRDKQVAKAVAECEKAHTERVLVLTERLAEIHANSERPCYRPWGPTVKQDKQRQSRLFSGDLLQQLDPGVKDEG